MSTRHIILFDGMCNLCNWSVQYVIRHDPAGLFRFAWLQSETGRELLKQYDLSAIDLDTFVFIEDNKAYTKSTAALRVTRKLKGISRLLYGLIIVPAFIRDSVYKLIAKYRYKWFGKKDVCMVSSNTLKERFLN